MGKAFRGIGKLSSSLDRWAVKAGSLALFATMLIAVANMCLRPFGHPVTGSFELMGLGCAITAALGLAMAQEAGSHISVDILFNRFPLLLRRFLSAAGSLVCAGLFVAAAWRLWHMGMTQLDTGELSETLRLPFYPVIWIAGAGFGLLALRLVVEASCSIFCPQR